MKLEYGTELKYGLKVEYVDKEHDKTRVWDGAKEHDKTRV